MGKQHGFNKAYFEQLFGTEEAMGCYQGDYYTGKPIVTAEEFERLPEHLRAVLNETDLCTLVTQEIYDSLPENKRNFVHIGFDKIDFTGRIMDVATLLPNGERMSICTNNAQYVIDTLATGKIYGFESKDNPSLDPEIVDEYYHSDGHDFAVIDDRFIVDPWISTYNIGVRKNQLVYDLHAQEDKAEITAIYGDPACWLVQEGGEFIKPEIPPSFKRYPEEEEGQYACLDFDIQPGLNAGA